MTHFLRPLCTRRLVLISLLPCVRMLPDLRVHRTGTPLWSDEDVWSVCVLTACVTVRSKKVQMFVRLCVGVRRQVVVCVQEIKRASTTRAETQMFEVLRGGLLVPSVGVGPVGALSRIVWVRVGFWALGASVSACIQLDILQVYLRCARGMARGRLGCCSEYARDLGLVPEAYCRS